MYNVFHAAWYKVVSQATVSDIFISYHESLINFKVSKLEKVLLACKKKKMIQKDNNRKDNTKSATFGYGYKVVNLIPSPRGINTVFLIHPIKTF